MISMEVEDNKRIRKELVLQIAKVYIHHYE